MGDVVEDIKGIRFIFLLYGHDSYSINTNASILKCTITFLKSSERFDIPLL